jgi:hypothetical protein
MRPISISSIVAMSPAQRKALWNDSPLSPQGPRDERPLPDFSATEQFALVSKGRSALCRKVTSLLWKSTVNRPQAKDFRLLEEFGLLTQPAPFKHEPTDRGLRVAHNTALRIARELGLHEFAGRTVTAETIAITCTCGHRSSSPQYHHDADFRSRQKFLQHLSDVAQGKWKAP